MERYKRGALVAALLADILFNVLALVEMHKRERAWNNAVAEDLENAKTKETDGVSGNNS